MNKLTKIATALCSMCIAAGSLPSLGAAACNLTKEELLVKYGSLCKIEKCISVDLSEQNNRNYRAQEDVSRAVTPTLGETVSSGKEGGFCFDLLDAGCARITGLDTEAIPANTIALVIPGEIGGAPVREIGYAAFADANKQLPSLRTVIVPDSAEYIAPCAFLRVFGNWNERLSQETGEWDRGYSINLPENVRYIGAHAYSSCAFALIPAGAERIIRLPECLEYISATAFDDAVGSRVLSRMKIEVDMPESLVFLSDETFHTDRAWVGTAIIDECSRNWEVDENVREADLPLIRSILGRGFVNGERNICTMKDVLRSYLEDNGLTQDDPLPYEITRTFGYYAPFAGSYDNMLTLAEKNAPELLPEVPHEMGDVNIDGSVTVSDAIMLNRMLSEDPEIGTASHSFRNADLDENGTLDLQDFRTLLHSLQ